MTEDDLRKFDKEVLVQFIYADTVFYRQEATEKLLHYDKRLRFKKLMEKSLELADEMKNTDSEKYFAEWNSHYKKWQRVQKQMSKILGK